MPKNSSSYATGMVPNDVGRTVRR